MDALTIAGLKPELEQFLARFDDCFARRDTRAHLTTYGGGQLLNVERKNVEAMAREAGVPVRTLQEFLSQHKWNEDLVRQRLLAMVRDEHAHEHSIGMIDETSDDKKGDKTPGVQRQHLGCSGKLDNGIVTVHLAYAADDFHCLLDGELFLPQSWSDNRPRCREAGIPDTMVYRPKSEIALELYDRARKAGVNFAWLTFDEWYGAKPAFLQGLDDRGQYFVGETHGRFGLWQLLVCRNVTNPTEVKYFISNAPPETPTETLLLVAFSRWRVERCFQDDKGEVGLDHDEGRRYIGLKRHLILSAVSLLFLARVDQQLRKKQQGMDSLSGPHGDLRCDHLIVA